MSESLVTVAEVNDFTSRELPFCDEFGFRCEELFAGQAIGRWSYDERWTRPVAFVAGPVMMGLADAVAYWSIFTRTGIVPLALTNELKMNFLRPAIGKDLLARGSVVKLGRRIAFVGIDVWCDGDPDRLVAHATTSYVMPDVDSSGTSTT